MEGFNSTHAILVLGIMMSIWAVYKSAVQEKTEFGKLAEVVGQTNTSAKLAAESAEKASGNLSAIQESVAGAVKKVDLIDARVTALEKKGPEKFLVTWDASKPLGVFMVKSPHMVAKKNPNTGKVQTAAPSASQ